MSINKLQAALASATNEVTVAAANLNFDFTLIKYEAPKEYQALGNVLSMKRKDNAEHGASHVTARQLGALFEGSCPAAPSLLEAYGTRASEIAKASEIMSEPYVGTLFSEYTGIDGTSIWAAATSSKSAIHVHLLACMLARMWKAPEAIAIWVELIKERKRDIADRLDKGEGVRFSLAAAVGQEVTRPQVAGWDASARAWLRTADVVQGRNQKQLELILKNIDLPVSIDSKVFSSVLTAWSTAIKTMDKLVAGMPQAVQNGAALLGLSAWHLYPDMSVFSPQIVPVKMGDPLVARGGVLSLGLSSTHHISNDNNGVFWSLSLAHLRHYGRPVQSERALGSGSRITFPQLGLAVFSALLAVWRITESQSELAAKAVISLADYINRDQKASVPDKRLIRMLRDMASAFAESSATDQELNHKLIQLGCRRAQGFFGVRHIDTRHTLFFGMLEPEHFIRFLKDPEAQIAFLRHIAAEQANDTTALDNFIIRYKHDGPNSEILTETRPRGPIDDHEYTIDGFSYATAVPLREGPHPSLSSTHTPIGGITGHNRWLPSHLHGATMSDAESFVFGAENLFKSWHDCVQITPRNATDDYTYHFLFGDTTKAALFARRQPNSSIQLDVTITLDDFLWCIVNNLFNPVTLFEHIVQPDMRITSKKLNDIWVEDTLIALAFAAMVYDDLPNATIDVGILNGPLVNFYWAQNPKLEYRHFFSLLTHFESGVHDVSPDHLGHVIALSSANSLFVPLPLIRDPYKSLGAHKNVQMILGNVGKPGITFLLPPQEPMTRELDHNSWRIGNYRDFDGTSASSFQGTSVHLSFTDYHVPMYDGSRGSHDNQISLLESVISVRDKGEWVADIDPSPLLYRGDFETHYIQNLGPQLPCHHSRDANPNRDITAVDSWDELIDRPDGSFVVRTGGNWVARLAATMVAHQRLKSTSLTSALTVCPPDVCWTCVPQHFALHAYIF